MCQYNNNSNDMYWERYVYDLTYYILIITIFLNIIFGIIIDAFGELREEVEEEEEQIVGLCFICGLEKREFETE